MSTSIKRVAARFMAQKVKRIFKKSHKAYGTRRIKKQLEAEGLVVSRQRIRRKMAELGLVAKARRKTRATTDSNHDKPVAPNLLGRQFDVKYPNKAWVMDITYIATREGWLYLAVVIDLYSRMVVGWSIDKRMTKELVINALNVAIKRRNPSPGLICHSDRGSQYCSNAYQDLLKKHGFLCRLKSDAESIPVSSCGIAIFTISESKTDHEFLVHLLAFLKLDKGST
ncbi:MAG: IS3 family transposase [Bacillota bacterium]